MNRYLLVGIATVAVGVPVYLWFAFGSEAEATEGFLSWPPGPVAIRQDVDGPQSGSQSLADREARFAMLFQNRYRKHSPPMAIGMRFLPHDHIKLMCPARLESWNMGLLAVSAWHESHDVLGRPFDVDIYETYIGTKPRKIGELRALPNRPTAAHIAYHYTPLQGSAFVPSGGAGGMAGDGKGAPAGNRRLRTPGPDGNAPSD
jgi:hypothetical protein